MQDGLSKNLRSPDKGVLCPFGPLGADYRESESRKGSGKATFAYRFVNCNEISVINQRFPNDEVVYGDSGFVGIQKRPEIKENEHLASIDYRIVRRPGSLPKVSDNAIDWERFIDHRKASIRCKVEHVFRIVKRQFGYAKTAYRGLQKNANRLYALFLSSNLYMLARAGRSLQKLEIA